MQTEKVSVLTLSLSENHRRLREICSQRIFNMHRISKQVRQIQDAKSFNMKLKSLKVALTLKYLQFKSKHF